MWPDELLDFRAVGAKLVQSQIRIIKDVFTSRYPHHGDDNSIEVYGIQSVSWAGLRGQDEVVEWSLPKFYRHPTVAGHNFETEYKQVFRARELNMLSWESGSPFRIIGLRTGFVGLQMG